MVLGLLLLTEGFLNRYICGGENKGRFIDVNIIFWKRSEKYNFVSILIWKHLERLVSFLKTKCVLVNKRKF